MPIPARLTRLLPEIAGWRHDLHQHPELDFAVERTAALVARQLRAIGCDEVKEGIGRTGVVGLLRGSLSGARRTIGLRADMDALPIHEATGASYASLTPGRMHACGHDGHTAMLLGAATVLAENRQFSGAVAFIFQPAEENSGGGREMVGDGLMDRFAIDEVYGMHNWPGLPIGSFAIRPGPIMASADTFDIVIEGKGGHAAMPHQCIDSTVIAADTILALQQIASRRIDPLHPVVVSVTSINTPSEAYNVLPQQVHLRGTVRALSEEVRTLAQQAVKEIARGTARARGASASVDYRIGYPVTVNSEAQTRFAASIAAAVVPADRVNNNILPSMGSEDFSYMLDARPGAFIFLGNGDSAALHHPKYDFNDRCLAPGCAYWIELVHQALLSA